MSPERLVCLCLGASLAARGLYDLVAEPAAWPVALGAILLGATGMAWVGMEERRDRLRAELEAERERIRQAEESAGGRP